MEKRSRYVRGYVGIIIILIVVVVVVFLMLDQYKSQGLIPRGTQTDETTGTSADHVTLIFGQKSAMFATC